MTLNVSGRDPMARTADGESAGSRRPLMGEPASRPDDLPSGACPTDATASTERRLGRLEGELFLNAGVSSAEATSPLKEQSDSRCDHSSGPGGRTHTHPASRCFDA